jgi:hypothetical protein
MKSSDEFAGNSLGRVFFPKLIGALSQFQEYLFLAIVSEELARAGWRW